jgi:hypothetical protein
LKSSELSAQQSHSQDRNKVPHVSSQDLKQQHIDPNQVQEVILRAVRGHDNNTDNGGWPDLNIQYLLALMLIDKKVTFRSIYNKARMQDAAISAFRWRYAAGLPVLGTRPAASPIPPVPVRPAPASEVKLEAQRSQYPERHAARTHSHNARASRPIPQMTICLETFWRTTWSEEFMLAPRSPTPNGAPTALRNTLFSPRT